MKRLALGLLLAALAAGSFAQERTLKLRLAVAPLDWTDREWIDSWRIPIEFRNAIYEKLVKKLSDTGKFMVLEREAMEALLKEQAIKEDNTGKSTKGSIVPAQFLVKGKVTDFMIGSKGGGAGVSIGGVRVGGNVTEAKAGINVRMFDVDTSEVIATESATRSVSATGFNVSGYFKNVGTNFNTFEKSPLGEATTKAIDAAVELILKKLGNQPWSCLAADYDEPSKEITLNAGSDAGVQVGNVFEVYKVTRIIKDPETGAVLGKRTSKIGTIKVIDVDKKFSIATVVEGSGFEAGCIVKEITKS